MKNLYFLIFILISASFLIGSLYTQIRKLESRQIAPKPPGEQAAVKRAVSTTSPPPINSPKSVALPTIKPTSIPTELPTPIPREIVKGSTPKGVQFYDKVEGLRKQGLIYGELYKEFESDPIVDANPEMQSVQIGLRYTTITGRVDETDKNQVLSDFETIKELAEQDSALSIPQYKTLRMFVLTFHDDTGEARGEVEQMMIDDKPRWIDW